MIKTLVSADALEHPIEVLQEVFRTSGQPLIKVAFRHSYFLDPERVREAPVRFPGFARFSRTHYPGKKKGDVADWNGRQIRIDDNARAQMALTRYSGRPLSRASGYGVRHIWGHPWDPDAYTAGWNLCYMPFWAGMLTEDQHCLPELKLAIQQVSYELYFKHDPVCARPAFVTDQGVDLTNVLQKQPILILGKPAVTSVDSVTAPSSPEMAILRIRAQTHSSWRNVLKGIALLQGRLDVEFGSLNVERSSRAVVRRMLRETGLDLDSLKHLIETWRKGREHARSSSRPTGS